MKKFIKTLGAVLTGMALVFGTISCSQEVKLEEKTVEKTVEKKVYTCPSCGTEYGSAAEATTCYAGHGDTYAPSEVTSLTATNLDNAVVLKWTDPWDSDLFGIEITWTPQTVNASRAVAAMEANSLFVAPGKQIAEISNLKNGVEYTFFVKAMDTSGNKSSAETVTITPAEIECGALSITLTPATTDGTNQDYDVAVAVSTKEGRSIKTVKYAAGAKDLAYFESNGTVCDSSFTVSENNVYTVYAQDIDGRVGLKSIVISNIDKVAPNAVTGLTANYSFTAKKLTVSWTNPSDAENVLLSYTKAGTAVVTDTSIPKTTTSYEINDYTADGTTEFVFTVKAVDAVGNVGTSATCSITPVANAAVTELTLNRYHFAYNDANQTVAATARITNADKIEDGTEVKFQILKDGAAYVNTTAVLDKAAGTATATLTAPATSKSRNGTTYTVRLKIGDDIDKVHTARFNVSEGPYLYSSMTQSLSDSNYSSNKIQIAKADVTAESKLFVKLRGYNLDASPVTLQFFDSTGLGYFTEPVQFPMDRITWTATTGDNSLTDVYTTLPLPQDDGEYTLKVFLNGVASSYTTTLQIYDVPKFTSFTIPKAGTSKKDFSVTATVKGKNFTAPDITADSFTVSCASKPSITSDSVVTIVDDHTLNVTLTIPDGEGSYDVKISSGENSKTGTFTVKDYGTVAVGNIVYTDGSISSYEEFDSSKTSMAIVAYINDYDVPIILGLKVSETKLRLAMENTKFYTSVLKDMVSEATGYGGFIGDLDGSDNWECIKSVDPEFTENASENYPAFYYAENYGLEFEDKFKSGWYIPSVAEIKLIYNNKANFNNSLTCCKSTLKDDLNTSTYWTSSIHIAYSGDVYYWALHSAYNNTYYGKDTSWYVLCIKQL